MLRSAVLGTTAARVVLDTIFGERHRFGKLPYTIYPAGYVQHVGLADMSMTTPPGRSYRYYTGTPTFSFGSGLSYAATEARSVTPSSLSYGGTDALEAHSFTVTVTNDADSAGDEVVQLYLRPRPTVATGAPLPLRQLVDFARVTVPARGSVDARFTVRATQLSLVNLAGERAIYPGEYELLATNGNEGSPSLAVRVSVTSSKPLVIDTM